MTTDRETTVEGCQRCSRRPVVWEVTTLSEKTYRLCDDCVNRESTGLGVTYTKRRVDGNSK